MNIGLVLSGGMAKGAYQVGALQTISEYLKPDQIKYISSASIGALNSYSFASNNLDYARKMWESVNDNKDKLFISSVLRGGYLTRTISLLSSKDNTEYMFEDGYKKSKSILDFVFSSGTDNIEYIYSQIEAMNSFNPKKQIRITGDVAINNLNNLAKRLSHRKIIE